MLKKNSPMAQLRVAARCFLCRRYRLLPSPRSRSATEEGLVQQVSYIKNKDGKLGTPRALPVYRYAQWRCVPLWAT